MSDGAPPDFDLTCWYINKRRVLELAGAASADFLLVERPPGPANHLFEMRELAGFKHIVTEWLQATNPATLGQLIIADSLQVGSIFTLYTDFFIRGGTRTWDAVQAGRYPVPPMMAYTKLDALKSGWKLTCRFHHEHMTTSSSWSELSGHKPLFLLAMVTAIQDQTIEAIPYVIANPLPGLSSKLSLPAQRWNWRLELFIDLIDSFKLVNEVRPRHSQRELKLLASIPESDIKRAFAEIIDEPTIPKDWGGERSDLFSTNVVVDGRRISTAFAFKGPAQFKPMTMAQLGKNGDQIDRLFSEPADLLVLQHCHEVTPPVRGAMRAYAQQMGRLRMFCIIDGYDTGRILRAYSKCGFVTVPAAVSGDAALPSASA